MMDNVLCFAALFAEPVKLVSNIIGIMESVLVAVAVLCALGVVRTQRSVASLPLPEKDAAKLCAFGCVLYSIFGSAVVVQAVMMSQAFFSRRIVGVLLGFAFLAVPMVVVIALGVSRYFPTFGRNKLVCIVGFVEGAAASYGLLCFSPLRGFSVETAAFGMVIQMVMLACMAYVVYSRILHHIHAGKAYGLVGELRKCVKGLRSGGAVQGSPLTSVLVLVCLSFSLSLVMCGLSQMAPATLSSGEDFRQSDSDNVSVVGVYDLLLRPVGVEYYDSNGELFAVTVYRYSPFGEYNVVESTYQGSLLVSYRKGVKWVDGGYETTVFNSDNTKRSMTRYDPSGTRVYQIVYGETSADDAHFVFGCDVDGNETYTRVSPEGVSLGEEHVVGE